MDIFRSGGLRKVALFSILCSSTLMWNQGWSFTSQLPSVSPTPNEPKLEETVGSLIILRSYEIREISEKSNQDGIPGPGEVLSLKIILENRGTKPLDLTQIVQSRTPYIRFFQRAEAFGEIAPGGKSEAVFQVEIQPDCPIDTLLSLFFFLNQDTVSLNLHILPQLTHLTVSSQFVSPGESIQLNSFFVDGTGRPTSRGIGEVKVVMKDPKGKVIEVLPLYEDGNFGNVWWTPQEPRDYLCDLEISDDRYFHQGLKEKVVGFTTVEFSRSGDLLLVMDTPDPSYEILFYYRSCLSRIPNPEFRIWNNWTEWNFWIRGKIDSLVLKEYLPEGVVIWSSPWGGTLRYDDEVQSVIQWFLDRGGKMLLSGGGIGSHIQEFGTEHDSLFFASSLKSRFVQSFGLEGYFESVEGISGDLISDGLLLKIVDEKGIPQYFAEEMDPLPSAIPFLTYSTQNGKGVRLGRIRSSGTAGLRVERGDSRLVYLNFGLEGIGEEEERRTLLKKILTWLFFGEAHRDEDTISQEAEIVSVKNFPNPFSPETFITYELPLDGELLLQVADIAGRTIKVLFQGNKIAGTYTTRWNGKDEWGKEVSSGVYFLNLVFHYIHAESIQTVRTTATQKILLLR